MHLADISDCKFSLCTFFKINIGGIQKMCSSFITLSLFDLATLEMIDKEIIENDGSANGSVRKNSYLSDIQVSA